MRRVMLIHHCSIEISSPSHQSSILVIVSLDLVEADRFGHTLAVKLKQLLYCVLLFNIQVALT